MALPTLDATFASSADLPRKQMLAKWLVEELGETQVPSSVAVSDAGSSEANGTYLYDGTHNGKGKWSLSATKYIQADDLGGGLFWRIYDDSGEGILYILESDTEYPWQGTYLTTNGAEPTPTVTEIPQPSPLSNYYSLPERYLWAKIAVAAGGPKTEADYISLPKNYAWSDIYNSVAGLIPPSNVLVSGAGSAVNGTYTLDGQEGGKNKYILNGNYISWLINEWVVYDDVNGDWVYASSDDTEFPWQATFITSNGEEPAPTVTEIPQPSPNHTDWSENVALGHIAAAYRGDTGNPANLATYIDWPWRYKVASIIVAL